MRRKLSSVAVLAVLIALGVFGAGLLSCSLTPIQIPLTDGTNPRVVELGATPNVDSAARRDAGIVDHYTGSGKPDGADNASDGRRDLGLGDGRARETAPSGDGQSQTDGTQPAADATTPGQAD